jgi:hypothetical protein
MQAFRTHLRNTQKHTHSQVEKFREARQYMETSCLLYALMVAFVIFAVCNVYVNQDTHMLESDDMNNSNFSSVVRSIRLRRLD